MKFQQWLGQFARNAYIYIIPGKLSENHLHAQLFSNPCWLVHKSMKSRGQICPILLRRKMNFPLGLESNHACKLILDNFPGIICMSAFLKIHFHAWLFSNPCGKVLIIVGISWSPDLRAQTYCSSLHCHSLQCYSLHCSPLYFPLPQFS